jgi:hypothetical protein
MLAEVLAVLIEVLAMHPFKRCPLGVRRNFSKVVNLPIRKSGDRTKTNQTTKQNLGLARLT